MQFLRPLSILALWAIVSNGIFAQQALDFAPAPNVDPIPLAIDRGAVALRQSLRKLQTRASVIEITAHPDDEDGGTLTYESRGQGARVDLLTLNRGEGGQNVMGNDYWDALGLVRTEELLQSDRYYGVQQYFTRVNDYGFSKTKEEAFEKWGHDRVLYDVVRVIRMIRPLVVTSVFVGGPTDGHGNHQVAGVMAQEVFNAAGDPNVFPDQIKAGLLPWKPVKVYSRVPFFAATKDGMYDYATGKYVPVRFYDYVNKKWIEGPLSSDLSLSTGSYDPVLGQSYAQIARTGLGWQRSQNGGSGPAMAGAVSASYHRFGSSIPTADKESSFFEGIDISLLGTAELANGEDNAFLKEGLRSISAAVQDATSNFDIEHPDRTAPSLARGLKLTRNLITQVEQSKLSSAARYNVTHELRVKEQQFNDALVQAFGISLLATVAPEKDPSGPFAFFAGLPETLQIAIPGQQFWVKVNAVKQGTAPIRVEKIALTPAGGESWKVQPTGEAPTALEENKPAIQRFLVTVPSNAKFTRPYYSRHDVEQSSYDILEESDLNLASTPYPLQAELQLAYEGESIRLSQVVQTVRRVTGPGIELHPLLVGPAISVSISPKVGVVPVTGGKFELTARVHSNVKGEAAGTLALQLPPGWRANPAQANFELAKDGEEQRVAFQILPAELAARSYEIKAVAEFNGEKYSEGYEMTGYEGLQPYPLYSPAEFAVKGVDVKLAKGVRVGYVMGTGDDVPKSLEEIGVKADFLSPQDIAMGDLSRYDCIVLGVRAYAARPELTTNNGRLLQYVKQGGILFVQYNSAQYDHNFGPYPYSLTTDPEKVVDETAKVTVLDPGNPLMSWPNRITSADFDGWVEERGHSFMKSWDSSYVALTEVHDPDQDPQKGGLLYTRYGKGAYIYGAFALYRQLPEGVPGAFRLFANVLSLAHSPAFSVHNGMAGKPRTKSGGNGSSGANGRGN
jgi:LmbE family N-acetylglucosaminyl deacetylase